MSIENREMILNRLKVAYKDEVLKSGRDLIVTNDLRRVCEDVADWLCSDAKDWLMLIGGIGLGKTTLSKAISTVIHNTQNSCVLWHSTEVLKKGLERVDWGYEPYTPTNLIIDDIGVESVVVKNFGNEITPVKDLIYNRYDARTDKRLLTIFTTNRDLFATDCENNLIDDYAVALGVRVIDRLKEMCDVIVFEGKSFRTN